MSILLNLLFSEWIVYTGKDGNPSNFFCSTCERILDKDHYILDPFGSSIDTVMDCGAGRINQMKAMLTYSFGINATVSVVPSSYSPCQFVMVIISVHSLLSHALPLIFDTYIKVLYEGSK